MYTFYGGNASESIVCSDNPVCSLLDFIEGRVMSCEGCKFHDEYTWVCTCADSKYCADFTDQGCEKYESGDEAKAFS